MRAEKQRVMLVTGATDGLGRAVAIDLAKRGATVLVHGRDPKRIESALHDVLAVSPARAARSYCADFESLDEVRRLAAEIGTNEPAIDVLINNAGIGGHGPREVTKAGIEKRFAVNYLAPYLLTKLLLPLIMRSAPARIVNVSSIGQQAIAFDDPMIEKSYSGMRAYCQSKLAQILMTVDLAAELETKNVTVNALHPATYMPTKMVTSPISTIEEGMLATVRLAVAHELDGVTGKFFDGERESRPNAQAYDLKAREQLRALSESLTQLI